MPHKHICHQNVRMKKLQHPFKFAKNGAGRRDPWVHSFEREFCFASAKKKRMGGVEKCRRKGRPAAYGSAVLNGEDVQVVGQARGACICLAVAQKCLAFHTTPPGTLVMLGQKFMKNRGRGGTRREKRATGWGAMERGVK